MGSADEFVKHRKMEKIKCTINKKLKRIFTKNHSEKAKDEIADTDEKADKDETANEDEIAIGKPEVVDKKDAERDFKRREYTQLTPQSISENLDKTRRLLMEKRLIAGDTTDSKHGRNLTNNSQCQSPNLVSVKQKSNSQCSDDSGFGELDNDEVPNTNDGKKILTKLNTPASLNTSLGAEKVIDTSEKLKSKETKPIRRNNDILESLNNLTISDTDKFEVHKENNGDSAVEDPACDKEDKVNEEVKSDEEKKKKRHVKVVLLSRGPIRSKDERTPSGPYQHQINQVNRSTLSGGHVLVKEAPAQPAPAQPAQLPLDSYEDIDVEDLMKTMCATIQFDEHTVSQALGEIASCLALAESDAEVPAPAPPDPPLLTHQLHGYEAPDGIPTDLLGSILTRYPYESLEFPNSPPNQILNSPPNEILNSPPNEILNSPPNEIFNSHLQEILNSPPNGILNSPPNGILNSPANQILNSPPNQILNSPPNEILNSPPNVHTSAAFGETPPPERISPGDILGWTEELLLPPSDCTPGLLTPPRSNESCAEWSPAERRGSTSMSVFKRRMQTLEAGYAARWCCRRERRHPKHSLVAQLESLPAARRSAMTLAVYKLELNVLLDVLYRSVLGALADPTPDATPDAAAPAANLALLALGCQRVLAERPEIFLDGYGVALLSRAATCCAARPQVTRYLVWCVRRALAERPAAGPGAACVYTETDARGDTLLGALARLGDAHADCLSELVAREPGDAPLFDVEHRNTDGYSALHLACQLHNAVTGPSTVHTVHVLLQHAGVSLKLTDNKAGDTPLHCAVEAAGCDLRLVLTLYQGVRGAARKELARCRNDGNKTPLDLARGAARMRPNYPQEVFEYLKKFR